MLLAEFVKIIKNGLWIPLIVLMLHHKTALAHKISVDVSRAEETDDIFKNAIGVSYKYHDAAGASLHYWKRSFGQAKEQRYLIAIYALAEPASLDLQASVGPTLLFQHTTFDEKPNPQKSYDYNIGLLLGLRAGLARYSNFTLSTSVDSHLFPAGSAIVFGITGRKFLISLSVTYAITQQKDTQPRQTLIPALMDYLNL